MRKKSFSFVMPPFFCNLAGGLLAGSGIFLFAGSVESSMMDLCPDGCNSRYEYAINYSDSVSYYSAEIQNCFNLVEEKKFIEASVRAGRVISQLNASRIDRDNIILFKSLAGFVTGTADFKSGNIKNGMNIIRSAMENYEKLIKRYTENLKINSIYASLLVSEADLLSQIGRVEDALIKISEAVTLLTAISKVSSDPRDVNQKIIEAFTLTFRVISSIEGYGALREAFNQAADTVKSIEFKNISDMKNMSLSMAISDLDSDIALGNFSDFKNKVKKIVILSKDLDSKIPDRILRIVENSVGILSEIGCRASVSTKFNAINVVNDVILYAEDTGSSHDNHELVVSSYYSAAEIIYRTGYFDAASINKLIGYIQKYIDNLSNSEAAYAKNIINLYHSIALVSAAADNLSLMRQASDKEIELIMQQSYTYGGLYWDVMLIKALLSRAENEVRLGHDGSDYAAEVINKILSNRLLLDQFEHMSLYGIKSYLILHNSNINSRYIDEFKDVHEKFYKKLESNVGASVYYYKAVTDYQKIHGLPLAPILNGTIKNNAHCQYLQN